MRVTDVRLTAMFRFQDIPKEQIEMVSDQIRCQHIGGAYQGKNHMKLFFNATASSLDDAFKAIQGFGLEVQEIDSSSLMADHNGKYATKGYRIVSPRPVNQ